jgi:hypothetical protein
LAQAGFAETAGQFNANALNQADRASQDALYQFAMQRAAMAAQAEQSNAGNMQAMAMANLGFRNQFALEQAAMAERAAAANAGYRQQTGLANTDIARQFALTQAQMQADAASQNAAAANQFGLANQAALNDSARINAGAQNQFALADAGFADAAAARRLQAAGMLGDLANSYAGNVRADLGLIGQLGDQQRAIEAQYAMAPLAQLQSLGELYGTTPNNLFSGQNVSGNSTMSGTNVTKSSPSLFNQMLAAASVASKFA